MVTIMLLKRLFAGVLLCGILFAIVFGGTVERIMTENRLKRIDEINAETEELNSRAQSGSSLAEEISQQRQQISSQSSSQRLGGILLGVVAPFLIASALFVFTVWITTRSINALERKVRRAQEELDILTEVHRRAQFFTAQDINYRPPPYERKAQ